MGQKLNELHQRLLTSVTGKSPQQQARQVRKNARVVARRRLRGAYPPFQCVVYRRTVFTD